MSTTGEKFPTAAVTAAEDPWLDNDWTTPTNVYADNAGTANITGPTYDSPDQSYVLKASGFDFSAIPDGSTINGVTCRVNAWYRSGQGSGSMDLLQLLDTSLAKVGTNQCATPVALTTTDTTIITKGGAADKWGNALDSAWVKNANFGVAIGIAATQANADVDVDYVTLEIDYTAAAGPTPQTVFDSVTTTETLVRQSGKPLPDALSTAESQQLATWKALAESFGLTEQLSTLLLGALRLAASDYIPAGGGTPTTRQLSIPSGKAGTDFEAGKITDDTNPLASFDPGSGKFSEWEACVEAIAELLMNGDQIEIRLAKSDAPLHLYTQMPQWTIGGGTTIADSLVTTEALIRQIGKAILDSLSLSDDVRIRVQASITDALAASEELAASAKRIVATSDAFAAAESLKAQMGRILAESLTAIEDLARTTGKPLSEILTLVESQQRTIRKSLADSLGIGEQLSAMLLKLLSLGEAFETIDKIRLQVATRVADVFGMSEIIRQQTGKPIAEIFAAIESMRLSSQKGLAESLGINEQLATMLLKLMALNESALFSETLRGLIGKQLAEAFSVNESLTAKTGKGLAESLIASEMVSRQTSKRVLDSLIITESLTTMLAKLYAIAETVVLAELVSRKIGKAINEQFMAPSESMSKEARHGVTDLFSASELLLMLLSAKHGMNDAFTFSESLVTSMLKRQAFNETFSFSEFIGRLVARTINESLGITEELGKDVYKLLSESVGLSDNLATAIIRRLFEDLSLTESLTELYIEGIAPLVQGFLLTELLPRFRLAEYANRFLLTESLPRFGVTACGERFARTPLDNRFNLVAA